MKMYAVVAQVSAARRLAWGRGSVSRPVRAGGKDARGLGNDGAAAPRATLDPAASRPVLPPPDDAASEAAASEAASSEAASWIAAIAARADRSAYARLFRLYAPKIKGHLVARGAAGGVADELTQEVMLIVWRKAGQFDPSRGTASGWLYTITRNRLLNHVRGARYPLPEPEPEEARAAERPDAQLEAAEERRRLAGALAELPPEQRAVLGGAYFRGQTLQEHAAEQNVPLGTVKTRVRLALGKLRGILAGGDET